MEPKFAYKVLNLAYGTGKTEIRKAYLELAKKFHPDSPTGSSNKFKEVN